MRKISYILLAALSLSSPIYALVFIVPNGTTETDTLTLPANGDSAIIEEGGAIDPTNAADNGVVIGDVNQTVLNRGRISTEDGNGIDNAGNFADAVITNSGLISATSTTGFPIFNDTGINVVITNSGQILNTGGHGIVNLGNDAVIINSGLISITGGGTPAHGIFSDVGDNVVIINSGLISTLVGGPNGHGIHIRNSSNSVITNSGKILIQDKGNGIVSNNGDDVVITNSGQIVNLGGGQGVRTLGENIVIINSGLISVMENGRGIFHDNRDNVHVINSGTIISEQSLALDLQELNPTLTLLRGSNLQGGVGVPDDNLNLNVETGLNLALTLDSGTFGNLGIKAPFVLVGDTIMVIDPTGLALQADVVADLSDTILGGIYRHRTAFACQCIPCGCGVWVQGIGSYRERSRDTKRVGYKNWQGGFLIGYDTDLCGGNVGLFGGVSFGKAEVDEQTQRAETTSYVGGVTYERLFCDCNTFLGLALAIGYVDWDNERFVMNNEAPGGVETAKADTGGVFVSPEVTLAHCFSSFFCSPTMSFTLRYAGLFLGDYHEKGSLANLSVKNREIDLLTTRFELALPYSASCEICCWSIEPYLGVFGRYQVGGNSVDAELLGDSLRFDPGSPQNLAAFLLGFRGVQSFDCFNLFLNLEGSFDNYSSSRILGEGGIGFSF